MNRVNLEILSYEDTVLGPLCLRRRELLASPGTIVTEVTLNHEFLMSSYNTDSERAISELSVKQHGGNGLRALVGGLGLGYTAFELLKSDRVASVEVIEFLPPVIEWLRSGLVPLSSELNDHPRLKIRQGDAYAELRAEPTELYDLIVIDIDHSPDDQLASSQHPFYTEDGVSKAKTHLAEGGVLSVWSYEQSGPFLDALNRVFDQTHVEPITTYNSLVQHEQTDWLYFGQRERKQED